MDLFKERIRGIRDKVIAERFPELSALEIMIDIEENSDELLGYGELTRGGYYIDVDLEMEKATDDELYGGLAHELAHIIMDEQKDDLIRLITDFIYGLGIKYRKDDKKMNFMNRGINQFIYRRCYAYVIEDERRTDLLAVEKGAGNKLLTFLEFHDRHHEKYESDDGLTASELRQILYPTIGLVSE